MSSIVTIESYSRLLEGLYQGPEEEQKWHTFLSQLKNILKLQYASLILRAPTISDSGLIFTSGQDADFEVLESTDNSYTGRYYAQDPLVNLPLEQVTTLEDNVSQELLLKSDYYKYFLEPFGITHIAGIDWLCTDNSRVSIRVTRTREQAAFSKPEKELLQLLVPHLRRAVTNAVQMHQLNSEMQLYAQFISNRSIAMVTLDKDGEILQKNATARAYIERDDGIAINRGRLNLKNNGLNEKLKLYIVEALEARSINLRGSINALTVPRTSGQLNYQLMVKAIPTQPYSETTSSPAIMVFIQDPEKNLEISVRLLMNLYSLTLSEATIAILLSEGNTMDQVAEELGVKKNTVRAHLRSIFVKTGVTQQSMLVSLVLTSLASGS